MELWNDRKVAENGPIWAREGSGGSSGFLGALAGLGASHFLKSDVWIVGGVVLGLLGGFVVAAIRDSDEI
jgi:hypothetical protein